jgi:hypothetical protein
MRTPRIKEAGAGFYHIISRVVDRRRVMDSDEKERFRTILRAMEAFSGCEILTHAILDKTRRITVSAGMGRRWAARSRPGAGSAR